jgi:uncharacterized membrane protein YhaH (DUF805 family)
LFGAILLFPILPLWFRRIHDTGINENWLTLPLMGLLLSISFWGDIRQPHSLLAQNILQFIVVAIKVLSVVLAVWLLITTLLPSKKETAGEITSDNKE